MGLKCDMSKGRKKERKTTLMSPPSVNYGVASFRVGQALYVIPKWALRELDGLQ